MKLISLGIQKSLINVETCRNHGNGIEKATGSTRSREQAVRGGMGENRWRHFSVGLLVVTLTDSLPSLFMTE